MRTACIVGSGPSGTACAHALLQSGIAVTMIDVGLEIEEPLRPLRASEAPVDTADFLEQVRRQRRRSAPSPSIPLKMPFGSDYAYRPLPATSLELADDTRLACSLARGGLSNAWGANVCGLAAGDCDDWPVGVAELRPHFEEAGRLVEVAGQAADSVDALYDLELPQRESYPLGPQGVHVLSRMQDHVAELERRGLHCGRAKLAIGARHSSNGEGCVSCGTCMHGCPYNAIFSSRDLLRRLETEPAFRYVPGHLARTFRETGERVSLQVEETSSGEVREMSFDRLYLACGVVGTTTIVARSLDLCAHVFPIRDCTKYLFPFLTDRRVRGALATPANTLSQVFVQSVGQESTPRLVHGQLYGYNDLMLDPLRRLVGGLALRLAPLGAPLLERVMIGMIYLHSDDSGVLRLHVHPEAAESGWGRITADRTTRSALVMTEFLGRLTAARARLGGRPLRFLAKEEPPGASQHFGGSLPMRREPDRWSTDVHGRPWGCQRTHCVDSSVLPAIPATPTALLLMANALRIARASTAL